MFPFCTPGNTPENLWFSGAFRGYKMGWFSGVSGRIKWKLRPEMC